MLSKSARWVVAMLLAFGFGFLSAPQAEAHDQGWIYNKTSITVWDGGITYSGAVLSAVSDYNYWTDLAVSDPGCDAYCDIIFAQGDWGSGWYGFADVINTAGEYCATFPDGWPTGNCNKTTKKADHGYVYFNTYYYPFSNSQANWVARQELGHHFGLAHVSCTTSSVMNGASCPRSALQPHDISDINALY